MQQFIVSAHWVDQDGRDSTRMEHIRARHIDEACETLELQVLADEHYVLDLWSEAMGDTSPPTA